MAVVALATTALFSSYTLKAGPMAAAGKGDAKFVLVVDPGHGGNDAGACDNGQKEKDINLAVGRALKDILAKKGKDIKVVMTRDNDTYLTLQQRADKANKSKGNLFVSIHTNSVAKENKNRRNVCGSSVYTLGLHKEGNNMEVARRENSVIELESDYAQKYSGFDPSKDESYIIFEMAQKKNLHNSIRFARQAQNKLVVKAGRKDRGIHQAGFWVLWATSMPSVLVELDFICNPEQAEFMGSDKGVKQMAEALAEAVLEYAGGNSKSVAVTHADMDDAEDLRSQPNAVAALAPASSSVQKTSVATVLGADNGNRAEYAKRRRRSADSRRKSESRDLQADEIPLHSASERLAEISVSDPEPEEPVLTGKEQAKRDKEAKKAAEAARKAAEKARKEEEKRARAEARKSASQGRTKSVQHIRTVYKIQILASKDNLSSDSPRFHGLAPISQFRENNLYKYTYGEFKTKDEAETLLNQVKTIIPDAFIIQTVVKQ